MDERKKGAGGRGGDAHVEGDNSSAEGGVGGEGVLGDGGTGGYARVFGNYSSAKGGLGGRGGLGPGQPGGDVEIIGNSVFTAGGQGGEASQADGRGGRGGRAFGISRRAHMRLPYGEPNTEPGRGGDAADTTQYKARRLIIEEAKARYFKANSLPLNDVWWDREVVPLEWLNLQLEREGHRWRVHVVDLEYEFTDQPEA